MKSSLRDVDPALWEWKFVAPKKSWKNNGSRSGADRNLNNSNHYYAEHISTTFYITNFPPHFESQDLKVLCEQFGTVAYSYIARKLSKLAFTLKERAVWVEISGLPLSAWTPSAYKKVAALFGSVMFIDNDQEEQKGCGKVCINSKILDYIHNIVKVEVEGMEYNVLIREISNWCPTILHEEDASSKEESENGFKSDEVEDTLELNEEEGHEDGESQNGEYVPNSFATNEHLNIAISKENKRSIEECNNLADAHEDSFSSGKLGSASCRHHVQSVRFHSPLHSNSESLKIRQLKKQSVNVGSLIAEMEKYVEFGKVLGYDLSGCKDDISVLGIQETKMIRLDLFLARSVWGNYNFEVASSGARGQSDGLLMMWDPTVFRHNKVWSFDHTLIVLGEYIIFGDFNVVRYQNERSGTMFCHQSADDFNNFIDLNDLVDVHMGGRKFTRIGEHGRKMAKLDRFLVSEGVLDLYHNLVATVLLRLWSDHSPIVIKDEYVDFGPTSFKLFHSRFKMEGFDMTVKV
ncbi:RNA-directed DNA polymerase, eukaryota [Tanacetum coccineum]|uniref:RNA-directed DNA polymerase, eukaryota n=1 Tax=Tanacetum coccineum TaxID=301880 RepID=A0ABQ4XTW4_9ASTR